MLALTQTSVSPVTNWGETPLRLLLDEIPLGVVRVDGETGRLEPNAAARSLLESPHGPAIEKALRQMRELSSEVDEPVELALSLGHFGEIRILLSRVNCVGGYLAVLERNALARVHAENQVMRALLESATGERAPEVAAQHALTRLGSVLRGSALVFYEHQPARGTLEVLAHVGVPAEQEALLSARPASLRGSLVGRVMVACQPLHLADLSRASFAFERELPRAERLSALALPVCAGPEALGVLAVYGPRELLTLGELKLLEGLADALGAVISHGRRDARFTRHRLAMSSLVDNLPDAIFDVSPEGTIRAAEGRVAGLLGRAPAELVDTALAALVLEEDHPRLRQLLAQATPTERRSAELQVGHGNGGRVWCEVSAWVAPALGGGTVLRTLFRDITQRRRLEADFAAARIMAIQRDRLAMIGQLAAGVAHEINNPLSFVKSNLTLMATVLGEVAVGLQQALGPGAPADSGKLTHALSELEEMTRDSLSGVGRITTIVHSLKGLARSRPGEHASFNPGEAVRQAVQFFSGGRHCKGLVKLEVGTLPMVRGEAGGLSQVVLNLLDNAFDAVGGAGQVVVRGEARGDRVVIEVRDDGPGIPPEVQAHLFEPFFTTKAPGKGTGLGLHISNEIVAALGGTLRFQSGPQGTTFFVELRAEQEVAGG